MSLITKDAVIDNLFDRIDELQERLEQLERFAITEEVDTMNNQGYIGGAWQKDPIRLGYSGVVSELVSDTALAAGSNTLSGTAVPAGEIHIITNIVVLYSGTVSGVSLRPLVTVDSVDSFIDELTSITSGQYYGTQGYWVLEPTDQVKLQVLGATLNDDAYLRFSGFRVDIDL